MNWLTLAFIAMITNSFALLLIRKIGKRMKPEVMTFYIFLMLAISLAIINVIFSKAFFISSSLFIPLVTIGIMGGTTYLLFYKSISLAPNPGYSIAIFSLNVIIITLISNIILDTSLNLTKLLGIVIATLGTILLTLLK